MNLFDFFSCIVGAFYFDRRSGVLKATPSTISFVSSSQSDYTLYYSFLQLTRFTATRHRFVPHAASVYRHYHGYLREPD